MGPAGEPGATLRRASPRWRASGWRKCRRNRSRPPGPASGPWPSAQGSNISPGGPGLPGYGPTSCGSVPAIGCSSRGMRDRGSSASPGSRGTAPAWPGGTGRRRPRDGTRCPPSAPADESGATTLRMPAQGPPDRRPMPPAGLPASEREGISLSGPYWNGRWVAISAGRWPRHRG